MRGTRQRSVFRLELGCGHTAFVSPSEPHDKHRTLFCHACDGSASILAVARYDYVAGPPEALRRSSRDAGAVYERWGCS